MAIFLEEVRQVLPNLVMMTKDFDDVPGSEISVLLSCDMALQHIHRTHHWRTLGGAYYSDHLLFQRLYEDLVDEIDQLAERAVGLGGADLVDMDLVCSHAAQFIQCIKPDRASNSGPENLVIFSLRAEKCFLSLLDVVNKLLESGNALSMGTDDLLQSVANLHEEHLYLLRQRTGDRTASLAERVVQRVAK